MMLPFPRTPDNWQLWIMRPASRFLDPLAIEPIKAGVGIGLQYAGEVGEVRARALALAIRAVAEEHGRRIRASRRPIIAHVRPQPPLLGSAPARAEHWHRRVVPVDLVSAEHVAADRVHQRLKQCARTADPVGEGRAIKIETLPRVD